MSFDSSKISSASSNSIKISKTKSISPGPFLSIIQRFVYFITKTFIKTPTWMNTTEFCWISLALSTMRTKSCRVTRSLVLSRAVRSNLIWINLYNLASKTRSRRISSHRWWAQRKSTWRMFELKGKKHLETSISDTRMQLFQFSSFKNKTKQVRMKKMTSKSIQLNLSFSTTLSRKIRMRFKTISNRITPKYS